MVRYIWKGKTSFNLQSMSVNGKIQILESHFDFYFTIYQRLCYILNIYVLCVDVPPEDDHVMAETCTSNLYM